MTPVAMRLVDVRFHERAVKLRLPFRFGAVTLTEAPQAFARAHVRLADGREGEGVSADLLVPKWFDKSPSLTNEQNFAQLRRSLLLARAAFLHAGEHTAFGLSAAIESSHHDACEREGLNGLIASFGLALIERAMLDALGRTENASVFDLVRDNRIGLDASTAPDLEGFDFSRFLAALSPAPSILVRHTVGLVDPLTEDDVSLGARLNDGLPEALAEVVAAYGCRYFKIKVAGQTEADLDRLMRIASVLDRFPEPYSTTLDGNEQFNDIEGVVALWRRIGEEPSLARLKASILHIEQPIARANALAKPVHALAREIPLEIDESDADMEAFPRARALGYRGVSSKSCKGFYRALINRARVARWNGEESGERYFMSAEDLTTQAGVAVQQDLALATLIGAAHVERNGHHYVDGMAGAPEAEQQAFLAAHPALYADVGGRARLRIDAGALDITSLACVPGLAAGVMPDFSAMRPIAQG